MKTENKNETISSINNPELHESNNYIIENNHFESKK